MLRFDRMQLRAYGTSNTGSDTTPFRPAIRDLTAPRLAASSVLREESRTLSHTNRRPLATLLITAPFTPPKTIQADH